jgi:hypothetical protein
MSRKFVNILKNTYRTDGPKIVQENLIRGLRGLGVPIVLNPRRKNLSRMVGVLSNVEALNWIITEKKAGRIDILVAGPNLVVTPFENDSILLDPAIDIVVTPSAWVSEYYRDLAPELEHKTAEWAVGIDTRKWRPSGKLERKYWLIYDKTRYGGKKELDVVEKALKKRKLEYRRLIYGRYTPTIYLSALQEAHAMVVISPTESQGIAQFEAWSCDVPTVVWDRGYFEYNGLRYEKSKISSSPYLTKECGERFKTAEMFEEALELFLLNINNYSPRTYVIRNYSLIESARRYVSLFNERPSH